MNGYGRGSDEKKNKQKESILTRETVGMTLLLFSALLFLICASGRYLFGDVGLAIGAFFVGLFGFFAYPLLLYFVYLSVELIRGKRLFSAGKEVRTALLVVSVYLIVHTATAERFAALSYGEYLGACWNAATESLLNGTGGGILFGLVVYPFRFLMQEAGVYVFFSALLLLALWFFLMGTPLKGLIFRTVPRAERERKEAVSIDDLPVERKAHAEPSPAAAEERPAQPEPRPEPSMPLTERPKPRIRTYQPGQGEAHDRSMELLYGGNPSDLYSANRAYNVDSELNRPRRSTMTPVTDTERSYSENYTGDASRGIPKRVTGGAKPQEGGYSYPAVRDEYDANYPSAPLYRIPADPPKPQNYYVNDVPADPPKPQNYYANDVPADPQPVPPASQEPFGNLSSDPQPEPEPEPAPAPEIRDPFGYGQGGEEPSGRFGFGRGEEKPDPAVQPPEDLGRETKPLSDRERSAALRAIFARDPEARGGLGGRNVPDEGFGGRNVPDEGFGGRNVPDEGFGGRNVGETDGDDRLGGSRVIESGLGGVRREDSQADIFDDDNIDEPPIPERRRSEPDPILERGRREEPVRPENREIPKKKRHIWKKYRAPSAELLVSYEDRAELSREEIGRVSGIILDTLSRYRINTDVIGVKSGASVTRYDLAMPSNTTINSIIKYSVEIAVNLRVGSVNMFANPEVGGISVEVPNAHRSIVGLKSILTSEEFKKQKTGALTFALGQDVEGRNVCGDISEMTHILIAGQTGSGKSITIHCMIMSLIMKYSPEDLRLILIDPKQTEFTIYEGLPHLMINEIITEAPKAVAALNWAIQEMERRYSLFNEKTRSGFAVRKIDEYNANLTPDEEKLPKIVIFVDEFADLMIVAKKELEEKIQRLTQKARAAGIHLILATQRPSADVVTGIIKSNLPTRIALKVDSELNSRIILDEMGAEKLLGYGDMLVKPGGRPMRVQGAYADTTETQSIVSYIKENNECDFDEDASAFIDKPAVEEAPDDVSSEKKGGGTSEELNLRALAIVVRLGQASISLIQRKCGVGYNHAGKVLEWMEKKGYISPFDGKAKARGVLLTKQEFEAKYGPLDNY